MQNAAFAIPKLMLVTVTVGKNLYRSMTYRSIIFEVTLYILYGTRE